MKLRSDNKSLSENDSSCSDKDTSPKQFTQEQVQRMEKNRKRALEIKAAKENASKMPKLAINEHKKLVDTGAGFFLDEEDLVEEKKKEKVLTEEPAIPVPDEHLLCEQCKKTFPHSYLSINFECNVCDSCRTDFPDIYKLITRTDAKSEFLLKDCDFDAREPPLKYIEKKNPHNNRYAAMKLYLKSQCKERALQIHENEEKIEEKKEIRTLNLHKTRQKTYEKKVTALRKEARLGGHKVAEFHKHEYGEEIYNEEEETYYKICKTCDFKLEYEEL